MPQPPKATRDPARTEHRAASPDTPSDDGAAKVLTHRTDSTLVITINRPNVRNAVDQQTAVAIAAALDTLDQSDDLAVGVITGAGGTFCAGMDLRAFLRGESPTADDRGFAGIVRRPPVKPIIAAVDGPALGGGFEIVLACDLVVAGADAVFGVPEVRRGLTAAGGGLLRLAQRIPYHLAMECALTGQPIDAATAREVHLVNRLVPAGEAVNGALELADVVAANGPLAVRASKHILRESRSWPESEMWDRQQPIAQAVRDSADAREGAAAFAERRPPRWQGR